MTRVIVKRQYQRIEICGGIASGKTTLCNAMRATGWPALFEDFKQNPFWTLFYEDPKLHAFETEVTFVLQHYSQIKTAVQARSVTVFDFSLLQDRAYACLNLDGRRLEAFDAVYSYVVEDLPPPLLTIHLQCSPEEELRRIQNRARPEETSIQLAYLDALNQAIAHAVDEVRAVSILKIDSAALDFANNRGTQKRVVSDILAALARG